MLTIDTLSISSYDIDKLTISWTWSDSNEDESDFEIDIYRADGPGTSGSVEGYTLIASGISATTASYSDTTISGVYHFGRTWFYKLVLTDTTDDTTSILTDTPLYIFYETTDLVHAEILRRKTIALSYSSRPLYLLKRRSYGTRCTECWDATLMRSNDPNCTVCHGTSWISGYYEALLFNGMLTPSPKYNQITMFGEWMPSDVLLTMLNYPILAVNDVIVDNKNIRWAVKTVKTLEKKGYIIEQAAQLSRIVEGDIVYDIEVP